MSQRRYVMRGFIKSLVHRDASWKSRFHQTFLIIGCLTYQYRMRDGTQAEVAVEDEYAIEQEDEFVDDESLAEECAEEKEEEEEEKEKEEANGKAEEVVQQRRACALIVQDNGKLPLPHVGMAVSLLLERKELLPEYATNPEPTHRDYLYTIIYVKSWQCTGELKTLAFKAAFCDIDAAMREDRSRYEQTASLMVAGTRAKSVTAKQLLDYMSIFVVPDHYIAADVKRLSVGDRMHTMSLTALCAVRATSDFSVGAIHAFGNGFALGQGNLHALLPNRENIDTAANALRLDGTSVHDITAAELAALRRMCLNEALTTQLFFGARDTIPLFAIGSVASQWPGVQWFAARDKKLTAGMCKYLKQELPTFLSKAVEPAAVFALAHSLHCEQQVWWRREHEMFDATLLLAAVQVKSHRRQTAQPAADESSEAEEEGAEVKDKANRVKLVKAAIALLLHAGVWRHVPVQTKRRLRALNQWRRTPDGSLWFCTERQHALTNTLANCALKLMPKIVLTHGTGQAIVPTHDTLYVPCGPESTVAAHGSDNFLILPLHVFLERQQYIDNDDFFVVELLAFRRVVLHDAHLLEKAPLVQLMTLILAAKSIAPDLQFEMQGDPVLASPFREMVRSLCFHSSTYAVDARSNRVRKVFDEHKELFSGERNKRKRISLIQACVEASRMTKSDAGRQALVAALMHFALSKEDDVTWPDAIDKCLARQFVQDSLKRDRAPARWMLMCSSYGEAGTFLYPQLAHAAGTIGEKWARTLSAHFAMLAKTPQAAAEFVCFASPYIGYQRQCVRVLEFYAMIRAPEDGFDMQKTDCTLMADERHTDQAAVSLDCAQLYIAVELQQFPAIDHRICCHTWAENVMRVARHRHELCSQSFVMSRDALPFDALHCQVRKPAGTIVMCGANFRFEDAYRTFAQASVWHDQPYMIVNLDAATLPAQLAKRYPDRDTFLGDLLRAGTMEEEEADDQLEEEEKEEESEEEVEEEQEQDS